MAWLLCIELLLLLHIHEEATIVSSSPNNWLLFC
jgi:hypothetical protein